MVVVLIRPPTVTSQNAVGQDAAPPLGVAYLAASLRSADHSVHLVDALGEGLNNYQVIEEIPGALKHGLSDEEIIGRIPADADLIGISCMFSLEWVFTRTLVQRIRKAFPETPLIAGGEHITACPDFVLRDCPEINICVIGEGEETLVELAKVIEVGVPWQTVSGIAFKSSTKIIRTSPRQRRRNLEAIPRPAWDLVPIEAYLSNGVMTGVDLGRSMPILASRGCPYECTFCSNPEMWGRLWIARAPEDVIDEIIFLKERYGVTNFDFYDLTAIIRKDWIVAFTDVLIQQQLDITWQLPSGTRSEAIDEEVTQRLYDSGCRYINYAPESGSEEILKRIKKKIDKNRMIDSMRSAVNNKLKVKANFILGFPDEDYREVFKTYAFIIRLAVIGIHDISVFPFSPYPGSVLFAELRKNGVVTLDDVFFYSLAQYTDPGITKSYSSNFSDQMLSFLTLWGMAVFYSVSFLLRPWRLIALIIRIAQKKPLTKLETSIMRVSEKRHVRKRLGRNIVRNMSV